MRMYLSKHQAQMVIEAVSARYPADDKDAREILNNTYNSITMQQIKRTKKKEQKNN